jgi:hypothetical protein
MSQILSSKRLQIDKANATVTIVVAIASFLTISSLVMTKSLLARRSYQARVVSEKKKAADQLEKNIKAVDQLKVAYAEFIEKSPNAIGGLRDAPATGAGERDGDNAKITLDALPSKYDYPAVTTSLEKLLTQRNFKIESITGIDEEILQKDKVEANPTPVGMPFEFIVISNYDPITDLLKVLEKSIRPIQVQSLTLTAKDKTVQLELNAKTFYLPEKTLNITKRAVK